jgi:hypothetical protein
MQEVFLILIQVLRRGNELPLGMGDWGIGIEGLGVGN